MIMKKDITVSLIIFAAIIGGIFLVSRFKTPSVFDAVAWDREEKELRLIDDDLNTFAADEMILSEIDQTFSDIIEDITEVNATNVLDETLMNQEAEQADPSKDIADLNSEDSQLKEVDQVLSEILQ